MKKIIAIAWNDIKIEFSERSTLVFFLLLPVVFTTVVGMGLQNMYGSSDEDPRVAFVVVNEDEGGFGDQLVDVLEQSDVVRPVLEDAATAAARLNEEETVAVLTIPADFSQVLLDNREAQVALATLPSSNGALSVEQAVGAAVQRVSGALAVAHNAVQAAVEVRPFEDAAAQQAYFDAALAQAQESLDAPQVTAQTQVGEVIKNEIADGFEQSSPGQLVTWVLTTLLGASEVFVNERLGGTLRRLMIMPVRKATVFSGKILGRLGMGVVQMVILVGFGALVLGVNWGKSYAALGLMLLAFGLAGTAMGVMLGAFSRTRSQAGTLTVLFSMLLAALGGAWWPLEITPIGYQNVVRVLPSTWAMQGFKDVIIRGQGVAGVLPEVGILLGFAVLFFAVGIWKMKYE